MGGRYHGSGLVEDTIIPEGEKKTMRSRGLSEESKTIKPIDAASGVPIIRGQTRKEKKGNVQCNSA